LLRLLLFLTSTLGIQMKTLDKKLLNQLYRYSISLTNNEDLAYDLLQSSLEKYLSSKATDIEVPVAYIKRIIRNKFIDQTRQQRFQYDVDADGINQLTDEKALEAVSLEEIYIKQTEVDAVLGTMSSDERELLYLWAVEEYTFEEIAQMKQISRGTLLSRLHRLKKRVQLQLSSNNVLNLSIKK